MVEAIAQNNLKKSNTFAGSSSRAEGTLRLLFGLSAYVIIGFLLHYSYSKFPLSKINVMWSCLSIVTATFLGYLIYNEKINKNSLLAVIFALLAIYFSNLQV